MKFKRFGVRSDERFGIVDDEGEVAATAGARHLPGEDVIHGAVVGNGLGNVGVVLLGMTDIGGGNHAGEHGCLGLEGGSVGCGKGIEVLLQDGAPAGIGGIGKGLDLGGSDILALYHGAAGLAGLDGNHHEVLFEEAEGHLVVGVLDLLGPEVIVIIVTAEAGDADSDGVLGTRDVTTLTLGVVLEAEDKAGEHLGIHLGELHGPDLLYHLTSRGTHAAAVAHIEGGLQGDGNSPAGMILADVGLVDPGAGEVQPCWNAMRCGLLAVGLLGAEGGLEGTGAAGLETCMGGALQLNILDAALFAQLAFLGTASLGIDNEDVGLDDIERGDEVDDAAALIDIGFLDGLDILDHNRRSS